jgi:hypothetical protein
MTREWHNNEDAGDLGMQHAADASEFADHCHGCGEHLEDCPCGTDPDEYEDLYNEEEDREDSYSDAEADAHALSSIGWGTDEDYGYFGEDY